MIRGLMSDREWACLKAFAISRGAGSGRRPRNHRLVMDGIFWIARTGVALSALVFWQVAIGLPPVPTLDTVGSVGTDPRRLQ